jgi:hypothetical protein
MENSARRDPDRRLAPQDEGNQKLLAIQFGGEPAEHPPRSAKWCTPGHAATLRNHPRLAAKKRPSRQTAAQWADQRSALLPSRAKIPASSREIAPREKGTENPPTATLERRNGQDVSMGGCIPFLIIKARYFISNGRLSASATTVARPVGVRPRISRVSLLQQK